MTTQPTNTHRTIGNEEQSVELLSERTFRATANENYRHGVGPVLVTVRTTRTTVLTGDRAGVVCHPTYSVTVDDEHRCGGVAAHLPLDGVPELSFVTFGAELELDGECWCDWCNLTGTPCRSSLASAAR